MELHARPSPDYEYLDGGDGARLERFGPWTVHRPSSVALWDRERPALWEKADGVFHRTSEGTGHWEFRRKPPPTWPVRFGNFVFSVTPTAFGHMGLFPEHSCHWDWVEQQVRHGGGHCRVLHLFAYTGAMSLLAARAGAEVCHVDAVADVNDWARRNAAASGLTEAPIRWITDDAPKFVAREIRRNRRYDAVILDPPSYGKGPRGERWKIETDLLPLLRLLQQVMSESPRFVLFTCHTLGFSPVLLKNLLLPWQESLGGTIEGGTMVLSTPHSRRPLPSGFFARWLAPGAA